MNYGLGSILPRVISFFLIPLYTHYLNLSDYGIVELCGSIGLVIMTVMRFGVPGSVNRFYFDHKDKPDELKDYVTTIHRFLMAASVGVGLITAVIFYFFGKYMTPGLLFFPFIIIVLINNTLSANSDLQRRLLQSKEESRYTVYLNLFNAFIGIGAAIVFVVGFRMGALGILLSQMLTAVIFFIQAQVYLRKYNNGTFRWDMMKTSLSYGINTLPHLLFVLLAPLISKIVLIHTNSMSALGIFSLANRFTQPLQILYTAFNQAFNPIYYSLRKENTPHNKIQKYFRVVWLLCLILFIGTMFLFPPLIPMLTPPRFHASSELVPVLASCFIWQIIYFLSVIDLFYLKKTKYIPRITLGGLAFNVLITILLVGSMGPEALAWAQLGGCFLWAVISKYLVSKHGEVSISSKYLWHTLIISVVCLITEKYLANHMLIARGLVTLGMSSFLLYFYAIRDPELLEIIRHFKSRKKKAKEEPVETPDTVEFDQPD